ncbi:MAG TPA: adenosylmethionine decarboxylase [Accumulibacter sp.]|uniref:adenosylmethionine decarboxylase n=1 Tax=Accumulibacter sp. TaxID=2053492 RepID=UPI0026154B84|nr:adenosylmethionine decarboxylase [Accumulibacter sp.]MDS4055102.1 adenosylmethionine decarboxylase [Accumulibacter sp.]HMV05498.1 adenosylmethionine decarboxylase [Accumulibacter sp.]HMW64110.1 adenosylmethionine decarboxylase [Accumulibacter sp.]HMW80859.1 adenosylmethionine decarboxylase [Accumulibacter sp.]HNB68438.1 adenosylmethionine decarboxylase [Accumulibacter sp.]
MRQRARITGMRGVHLIAELYECRCAESLLADAPTLQDLCLSTCAAAGLTPVGFVFHQFASDQGPAGATGAVILAESHLAVHTWPEHGAVTLDLYVCNFSHDNTIAARAACRRLIAGFAPGHSVERELERGDYTLAAAGDGD